MRLIGTIANENQAQKIVRFLQSKGIESRSEPSFEAQSGYMSYQLWILDEDRLNEAAMHLSRFQQAPSDPEFEAAFQPVEKEEIAIEQVEPEAAQRKSSTPLTFFFLGLSIFLFLWSGMEEITLQQRGFLQRPFAMTPIQAKLMYDLPAPFEAFQTKLQSIPAAQTFDMLSSEAQKAIESPGAVSYWQGIYKWLILKINHQGTEEVLGPLFGKIFSGQIWRLFSPCILHGGFFHILFNMLWLWLLGRPIEERIGLQKTALLILAAGIFSNTAQYLMSGALFLGFSGVIMALASFIWMRQRIAPWEGYPVNRATISFLFLFIGAIFALTLVSFFLQIFTQVPFSPSIANTAHIVGGLIGACLGRFKFFALRVRGSE